MGWCFIITCVMGVLRLGALGLLAQENAGSSLGQTRTTDMGWQQQAL